MRSRSSWSVTVGLSLGSCSGWRNTPVRKRGGGEASDIDGDRFMGSLYIDGSRCMAMSSSHRRLVTARSQRRRGSREPVAARGSVRAYAPPTPGPGIGRLTRTEVAMDVPEPARALLEARYQNASWTLLHAWISDETVLAVVAVAEDDVFDPEEDHFDVDGVRIEALQMFDTLQEGWEIEEDAAFELGDVFGELVRAYEEGDAPAPDALES